MPKTEVLLLLIAVRLMACILQPGDSAVLGSETGPDRSTLGLVGAVRPLGATGLIAVLDSRMNRIVLFDCHGRFVSEVGRSGAGPGEFAVPVAMRVDPNNVVHVLDESTQRISRFTLDGTQLRYSSATTLPVAAADFCLVGRAYIVATATGRRLHRINTDGVDEAVLGPPQAAEANPLAGRILGRGLVECHASRRTIVLGLTQLPLVVAYTEAGDSLWDNKLEGHRRMIVTITPREVRTDLTQEGADFLVTLGRLTDSQLVVQLGRVMPGTRRSGEYARLTTYVIRVMDGRTTWVATRPKEHLLHVEGVLGFFESHDPYPRVIVRPLRPGFDKKEAP